MGNDRIEADTGTSASQLAIFSSQLGLNSPGPRLTRA
jgi:hypothetical protein